MFKQNKYSDWYDAIITRARADVNRTSGRFEKHHVIPKSLGGSNEPDNLVKLTPREHFICHLLLTKMTHGNHLFKMVSALNLMMNNTNKRLGRSKVTNRKYDASRFYANVQFSEEHRRKISEAAKRRDPATRKQTAEANEKRRQFMREYQKTPEHIAKQAESQRGQVRGSWGSHSDEAKEKLRAVHLGKPKSEEARRKMSEAKLGKKRGPMSEEHKAKIGIAIRAAAAARACAPLSSK